MFFNIGGAEILVIAMVALIAVGPEQLPAVLRKVGRVVSQVRSMTASLRDEFMAGLDDASDAVNPNSWIKGSGRVDDPIVPRGLADRANGRPATKEKQQPKDEPATGGVPASGESEPPAGELPPGDPLEERPEPGAPVDEERP
jgi:sec-independent protein translocase protein TatB